MYLDDILITSSSMTGHLQNLGAVLLKCMFLVDTVVVVSFSTKSYNFRCYDNKS